jgi:hypothetical protein
MVAAQDALEGTLRNALFRRKLENIHSGLMERYRDSQHYSSPIVGEEREEVKKELLSLILPPGYRIGSGSITDSTGFETGQVDAVIEQPFSLSFPVATSTNRLYLADTVGAAFEIKSDLNTQGEEALDKIIEIRQLECYQSEQGEPILFDLLLIPSFIVSFAGPKQLKTLEKHYINPRNRFAPNGVLVIESGLFYGRSAEGRWHEANGRTGSLLAFFSCVISSLKFRAQLPFDFLRYSELLSTPHAQGE